MLKRLIVLVMLMLFMSTALAQNDNRDFNGYLWYNDGIQFTYSLSIAGDATATFFPAAAGSPEFVKITFQDYHEDTGWLPTGAEMQIITVSTLPVTLPDLDEATLADHLRLLNNLDDVSIRVAQALDFQTGSGWRFVAFPKAEQGAANLSYRYVGKTTDGSYLITAVFPFTCIQFAEQGLASLAASDFTPRLDTLDALIESLRVMAPEAVRFTAETGGQVDYNNIGFAYDPELAYRVEIDEIAPVTPPESDSSMYGEMPGYTRFSLVGYPATGRVHQPQIFVMPVSQFPGADQPYSARLLELQTLLQERPELNPAADPSNYQAALPIFPLLNAAQTIVSQPQYLRFGSGEGLRYITYYAQSAEPLAADDLFYAFAGLSDDGQYVVAAIFPLDAGFLPQGRTVYDFADYERFMMNYQTYLDGLLLQIDVMAGSAYLPQLQLLDAMIASISVEG